MNNILANKFMDFLTDTIAKTKIPIWVALVAAAVLIIIIAVIILICVKKKADKNAPVVNATNTASSKTVANTVLKEDEMAFEQINEPVIMDNLGSKPVKTPIPVVVKQNNIAAQQPIEKSVIKDKVSPAVEPMATTAVKENVILPKRGINTTEVKMIAKPMAKSAEAAPVAKPVAKAAPVAKPIAAPVAKPVAKAAPAAKPIVAPVAKPVAKAAPVAKPIVAPVIKPVALDEEKETFGKFTIKYAASNPDRPFGFELVANNGQLLFESEPFKQKPRQASIDAFRKHVKEGVFTIDEDKQGTFRYKLYSNKNVLIGVGETYKSKTSCESSIDSVKRFAESATIIEDKTAQ